MCDSPTPEQAEIFQFASTDHNVLVTGQAGTGKSRVVNVIREHCQQRGLRAAVAVAAVVVRVESPAKCTTLA